MTCIVGVAERNMVWMGGDTATCDDDGWIIRTAPKVFRLGPLLVGVSGDRRACNLWRFDVKPPKAPAKGDPWRYVASSLADAVAKVFEEARQEEDCEGRKHWNGEALVGYRGEVYHVGADFGVTAVPGRAMAAGSGRHVALGALWATRGQAPEARVRVALEAAEAYTTTVRGPFTVETLGGRRARLKVA